MAICKICNSFYFREIGDSACSDKCEKSLNDRNIILLDIIKDCGFYLRKSNEDDLECYLILNTEDEECGLIYKENENWIYMIDHHKSISYYKKEWAFNDFKWEYARLLKIF